MNNELQASLGCLFMTIAAFVCTATAVLIAVAIKTLGA